MKMASEKTKKGTDAPRNSMYMFDPNEVVIIGFDTKDEDHPLLDANSNKLEPTEEFVANIAEKGVDTPIIVAKKPNEERYIVVAGRHRVRAARTANKGRKPEDLIRVPARVLRGDDLELMQKMVTENAARRDIPLLVKADQAVKIMELAGGPEKLSIEELAKTFAVSTTAVRQWMAIAMAPASIRRAVDQGKISATAAYQLVSKIDDAEKLAEALTEAIEEAGTSGKRATAAKVAKKAKEKSGHEGGISSKKILKELLEEADPLEDSEEEEDEDGYYLGFADALALVTGMRKPKDERGKKLASKARRLEKAA